MRPAHLSDVLRLQNARAVGGQVVARLNELIRVKEEVSEAKLAEIGGFWVLFEHLHFQAEKGVEKSRGKIERI